MVAPCPERAGVLSFASSLTLLQGPKAAGGKAAKAKAELEKKQEDQRVSDLSEFERLESERVVVEKIERKLLAAEKKARDEENARLESEYAHRGPMHTHRQNHV
jgi:hypothetical protein